VQVNDMDAVLLVEDIRSHLGVPLPGEMSEVNACIKQFLEICSRHCCFVLFLFCSLFIKTGVVTLSVSRLFRSLGNLPAARSDSHPSKDPEISEPDCAICKTAL
jgi:hypothetical protein